MDTTTVIVLIILVVFYYTYYVAKKPTNQTTLPTNQTTNQTTNLTTTTLPTVTPPTLATPSTPLPPLSSTICPTCIIGPLTPNTPLTYGQFLISSYTDYSYYAALDPGNAGLYIGMWSNNSLFPIIKFTFKTTYPNNFVAADKFALNVGRDGNLSIKNMTEPTKAGTWDLFSYLGTNNVTWYDPNYTKSWSLYIDSTSGVLLLFNGTSVVWSSQSVA